MRGEGVRVKTEHIVTVALFVGAFLLSFTTTEYRINLFSNFYISIILCLSISFIWGFCGTFSFGQTAMYAMGGYVYAIVAMNVDNPASTLLALLCAVVVTGLFAMILGYFIFYGGVNDMFVAIMTICINLSFSIFLTQTGGENWRVGNVLLGG